jgi:hypothetical protein
MIKGRNAAFFIDEKEGKNLVFPSFQLAAEIQ